MLKSGDWLKKMKDGTLLDEMRLGWVMYRKGRLKLLPHKIKGKEEIEKLFKNSS